MSWTEHTPHAHNLREPTALPDPPNSPEEAAPPPEEVADKASATVTTTIQTREIHLYTVPNRSVSGHYADSGLYRDIIKNPALYMDRADF
ncbi:hypothetical protein HZB58_04415 [Candidatus Gottesmanbacteria bacterium]|nr:hypothetical protein [Candidatus Gottesmanbacteria bacterium]